MEGMSQLTKDVEEWLEQGEDGGGGVRCILHDDGKHILMRVPQGGEWEHINGDPIQVDQ
jgi:hypothetical protein